LSDTGAAFERSCPDEFSIAAASTYDGHHGDDEYDTDGENDDENDNFNKTELVIIQYSLTLTQTLW
jgi:hypothetical protein